MKKLPVALVVGLAMAVAVDVVGLVVRTLPAVHIADRWHFIGLAMNLASALLVAVGIRELASRVPNSALRLASVLFVILMAAHWLRPVLEMFFDDRRRYFEVFRYVVIGTGIAHLAALFALIVAANGLRRAPLASVLVIVSAFGEGWLPGIDNTLFVWLWEHRLVAGLYWLAHGLMWAGGLFVLAKTITSDEPAADPTAAASGLRILAKALRWRIVLAIMIALLGMGMVHSLSAVRVLMVGAPLAMLATIVVAGLACLRVARANIDGLPSAQVAIGGGLLLWLSAVQLQQVSNAVSGFNNPDVLSIIAPAGGAAGLTLVGFAISAFAQARGLESLREAAGARTLMFVVLAAANIGAQQMVYTSSTSDTAILLMFAAAAASIASLLSFAGLANQAADAIDKGATLPEARVVSTSQP